MEINNHEKIFLISIPEPEILDAYPVLKYTKIDGSIISEVTNEEINAFESNARETMIKRALELGILDRAKQNAQIIISGFFAAFSANPDFDYDIKVSFVKLPNDEYIE